MSGEIIQFLPFAEAAAVAKVANGQTGAGAVARFQGLRRAKREKQAAVLATAPETLSATCRNKYLRDALKEPWRKADATREYWAPSIGHGVGNFKRATAWPAGGKPLSQMFFRTAFRDGRRIPQRPRNTDENAIAGYGRCQLEKGATVRLHV
jgi:hypothetical protein